MNIHKITSRYLIVFLIMGLLLGCTAKPFEESKILTDSRLGTSRAFVEAVIKGDQAVISKLDRSDTWPTDQVIKAVTPDFAKYESNDFRIYIAPGFPKGNVVYVQTKDERIKTAIIVEQFDDNQYYFMGFEGNEMPQL